MAEKVGPGTSGYSEFDNNVADAAVSWLQNKTEKQEKPWALFVSFLNPHFPLISPPEFYELYADVEMPMPLQYDPADRPSHPWVEVYRTFFNYDDYFDAESLHVALKAYYGMCSFLDFNIGRVISALSESGQADDTLVIYSSDHGDNLGNRGLWGKSVLYEEASAVPMMMAGPGIAEGQRCKTPVSLVDIYPTMVETVGSSLDDRERQLPGANLRELAQTAPEDRDVSCKSPQRSQSGHLFRLLRPLSSLPRRAGMLAGIPATGLKGLFRKSGRFVFEFGTYLPFNH